MLAVMKRELRTYFSTPIGYIFMGLFLLVSGFFFAYGNIIQRSTYYNGFLSSILFIFLFAVPLLTMRLLSEDARQHTDQLLLTSPLSITEIVLGKYLAAVVVFLLTLLITALYAVLVAVYGDLAMWETVGAYVGFILMGCCFISIGMFVSATTENQVTAAVVTFFALLLVWVIDLVQQAVPADILSGFIFTLVVAVGLGLFVYLSTRNLYVGILVAVVAVGAAVAVYVLNRPAYSRLIGKVLGWFSLQGRYESFTLGILKLDAVVYYLSFSATFVFLTARLIDRRRWS